MKTRRLAPAAAMVFAVGGCDKPAPEPTPRAAPAASVVPAIPPAPVAPANTGEPKRQLGVTWVAPEKWKLIPPGAGMRHASYEIPAAAGDKEPGDLGIFYFGADKGGAADSNVKRWIAQFEGVDEKKIKRSDRTVNGIVQHLVEISDGTYKSGMPGGPTTPKKGFAMIAAIVEAPTGNHFFKLVGPKKTVTGARAAFLDMLESVKAK
jgi:hypothetical protein